MSDNTPQGDAQDTTETSPLELADQGPTAAAPDASAMTPAAPAAGNSHTRTILEIVGGVVAAGLIVVAGIGGFAAGAALSENDDRGDFGRAVAERYLDGQQMPGQEGDRGMGDWGMGDQRRGHHDHDGMGDFGQEMRGQMGEMDDFGQEMRGQMGEMDDFGQGVPDEVTPTPGT